jgi:hypothetical protein
MTGPEGASLGITSRDHPLGPGAASIGTQKPCVAPGLLGMGQGRFLSGYSRASTMALYASVTERN